MQTVFVWLTRVFDTVLDWIPKEWDLLPLVLLSILVGFLVLMVYKYISSPRLIKKSKEKIKAHILAIRLYKDEWRVILKSFVSSLIFTLRYFALNLVPLLILIPLLAPVFAQLEVRYGLAPFRPGDLVEIKATFSENLDVLEPELLPEKWYRATMAPVYVYAHHQAHWQIQVLQPGTFQLELKTTGGRVEKQIRCGDDAIRSALSQKKHRGHILDGLLYPVEMPLEAAAPASAVRINYPGRTFSIFGLSLHWIWLHLLIVVLVVLALKKRFGIEF